MSDALLTVRQLTVSYGGIHAVKGIDFHVGEGEQVTLIGANGAGKTSTLRAITGLQPFGGELLFAGKPVRGVPAYQSLKQGLAMVPEGRGIFTRMTVLENLQNGAYLRKDARRATQETEHLFALFPPLQARLNQQPGLLFGL